MELNAILWILSNNTVNDLPYCIHYLSISEHPHEVFFIYPHYPFLLFFVMYAFEPLKPVLRRLDKNVCFLDIAQTPNNEYTIIGCDWCSICNGMLETAKQNLIKHPELIHQIDFCKLKFADYFFDFILIYRTDKITNVEHWCKATFGEINDNLLLFSRLYLKVELIELRWCPFKRSREFYYRNKDARYIEPTEQTIYEMGQLLRKKENCCDCPKIVNKKWKYTKSNKQSMFQPLLDYMVKDTKKLNC
jgi:hypothetical protein